MFKFHKSLSWNDKFLELKEHALQFADVELYLDKSKKYKDQHIIMHRYTPNNMPSWLHTMFNKEVSVFQIFGISPGSVGRIHKDGINENSALNIPLAFCDAGYMEWFPDMFTEVKIFNEYTKVRVIAEENDGGKINIVPTYRSIINEPNVIDTNTWHRINNLDNKNYRFILSIRFADNLYPEDLYNYLNQ
jgi:hypothetical protein